MMSELVFVALVVIGSASKAMRDIDAKGKR